MAFDSLAEPSTLSSALTVPPDERNIDDPARLADEAREIVQKAATELRAQRIPIETEPPTIFKAD
jgi:hypothetical protein